MRMALIAAAALLLAGMVWLATSQPPDSTAPSTVGGDRGEDEPRTPPRAVSAERNPILLEPRPGPAPETEPEPATARASDEPSTPKSAPAGRLDVEVRSRDGSPPEGFRHVLEQAGGRRTAERVGGHEMARALGLDQPATLTVEAEGFEPSGPIEVVVTQAEPTRHAYVYLVPAGLGTGVDLWVFGPGSVAVRWLEVAAWEKTGAEHRLLWRRRTSSGDGHYQLPDLRPNRSYKLQVRATTEDGELAPLMAYDEVINLAGRPRLQIDLKAGCFFRITATDAAGLVLGQDVNLRLLRPSGEAIPTRWRAQLNGDSIEREDGLPAEAPARLAEPVPPGNYRLQARLGNGPVTEQPVALIAGLEPELRLVLNR